MKKIFKKIYYIGGTIYRGLIGVWHNALDKAPEIKSGVENFVIGKSVNGREIKCYKIGGKVTGSLADARDRVGRILIVAGIHGNEVGTVKLARRVINWFYDICSRDAIYDVSKDVVKRDAINRVSTGGLTLYVIPVLNPDGYEQALKNPDYWQRGRVGRFNENGVDLNRNFPTRNFQKKSVWKSGRNYAECEEEVYGGEFGGSEPETRALIDFIQKENIQNLIMLHNVGSDVIINKGDETARHWAEIYNRNSHFAIRTSLNYSGSAAEWAREQGIHYMTVEGSKRWGSDWSKQKVAIEKILEFIQNNSSSNDQDMGDK